MKIDILNTFLVLTVLVSGLVEFSLAQPVEPIAHWKADGSTENSSGRPSIIGNPAVSYEQGVLGQAFSCTLNSPPIATDLDAQQSAMRSSTWSCWINAKDPGRGTRRQILSVDDGGFDRSVLLDNEFISVFTGTTSWQVAQVRPGEWTHVAVVWRRHSVVCYINGEAFEYKGKLSEQSTMRKLSIGRSPSFGERFIGLIDDIQIFDRALSEEDVLKLYEQGRLQASSVQAQTINGTPASASLPGPAAAPEVAKLEGTSAPPASEALRVDSAAAAAHIGKHVIARGNVAAIGKSTYTGLSYINFGKPYPDMELAACFATSDTNLANLKELEGRQGVEIEGTISADGRGRPQIVITSQEQVKSRGEPKAQATLRSADDASVRSTATTSSAPPSGGLFQRPDWVKRLRMISVADLTADVAETLQQDGTKRFVLRGRLMGVTYYVDSSNVYRLWMTSVGTSPAVSVVWHTNEGKSLTLEQVGGLIGREIEVVAIVTTPAASDRGGTELWSEGDPWLTDPHAAALSGPEVDPFAVFSSLPRLSVEDLQKVDFLKPGDDGSTPPAMGISTAKPVVVIGRLRDIRSGRSRETSFKLTASGDKPAIEFTMGNHEEEIGDLGELWGKEIAVVPDQVSFSGGVIGFKPATLFYKGRMRRAVFAADEFESGKPQTPSYGTLLEPLRVELKSDGKVVGSTTIKAGTSLPISRQEGVRALVKHAGGESWLLTGNEWEATPITNVGDRIYLFGAALAIHDDQPFVAWINKRGLWFAEQKAEQWEAQLVDAFPEGDEHGNASFRGSSCALAVGEGGRVMIVYELRSTSLGVSSGKVAFRYGSQWTIERGPPGEKHHAIRFMGDIPEVLAEQYGKPCLARWKNGEWVVERLQEPSGRFYEWAGQVSDAGDVSFLGFEMLSSSFQDKEYQGEVQLRSLVGKEWKSEVIESPAAAKGPHYLLGKLARAGQHTFAAYQLAEGSPYRLARSSGSWQVKDLNLDSLGERPRLDSLRVDDGGAAFLLFVRSLGREQRALLVEDKRPDLALMEALSLRDPLAMTLDSEGRPTVLFVDADQDLSIATRKCTVQLATSRPENGVLQLSSAPPIVVEAKPARILPERAIAGSEADLARRIASLTTTFSFPVDGEMTKFTRWGSGDKLIVFFNNNGEGEGPYGKFDSMPKEIEGQLQAYTPLLDEGYSLVVWDYPRTPRLAREVGEMNKKPDLAGIAATVVEGIRKETGASEMLLVGNSMGAGVLLWDLDKISSIDGVRALLISPTEFFMPTIDRLGGRLPNTTLISIDPDPFLRSPEIMAWAAKHASPPGGILEADQGEYIGHLIIGMDRLTHQEVVRLIRKALQPANQANDASND